MIRVTKEDLANTANYANRSKFISIFGFIVAGVMASFLGDKMERKFWLPISAVITLAGGLAIAFGLHDITLAVIGAFLIFVGMDFWVPISYTWVTECFPTRARATGFALADGLGHLGGGIGLIIVVAGITTIFKNSILPLFILICSFQIISAIIALFGPRTANKRLDEVSP